MGRILFSLAFATALLALASSEASAFLYSSFVCQAVGVRSVGWGRSFFIGEAKVIALSRCARRSGICTISYCVPGYWLLAQAAPECPCELARSFRPDWSGIHRGLPRARRERPRRTSPQRPILTPTSH